MNRLQLRSATEIHWYYTKKSRLHVLVSVLPTIPNIRLLSLFDDEITEVQQAIIFGLPTLRTLELSYCRFHPSTKPLPLSNVTALRLADNDIQTTRRLLTIVAPTLETLEFRYIEDTFGQHLQGELTKLHKLTTLKLVAHIFGVKPAMLETFKKCTSITTICILPFHDHALLSLHHSDLPALRSVTCDDQLAMTLIPKRPVKTYVQVLSRSLEEPSMLPDALSQTRARITSLKLHLPNSFYSLLPSLAPSLQHLEQLTLMSVMRPLVWYAARWPDQLSGQDLHNPSGAPAVVLPKLKRVEIWVDHSNLIGMEFTPERLLKECFIPACPALEVFECLGARGLHNFHFGLLPEPKEAWKVRRLPDGSWERQGPPPIPTHIHANKLYAAP